MASASRLDVTVLITAWRRPHAFERVAQAVLEQTARPAKIVVYQGDPAYPACDPAELAVQRAAWQAASHSDVARELAATPGFCWRHHDNQEGVWQRFFYAAMAVTTEFTLIVDDDTIMGRRWLEHCHDTFQVTPGVLGAVGVIFPPGRRRPYRRVGWVAPTATTEQVDIVGHSWFFRTEWLGKFIELGAQFRREPTCGEDYHLSYTVQQQFQLPTYCPAQTDPERRGNTTRKFTGTRHALWRQAGEEDKKLAAHRQYLAAGWRTLQG